MTAWAPNDLNIPASKTRHSHSHLQSNLSLQGSRGKLIAIMNIDVSNNKRDKLFIYQNDVEENIAHQFQLKHQLPDRAYNILLREIRKHKQQGATNSRQHQSVDQFNNVEHSTSDNQALHNQNFHQARHAVAPQSTRPTLPSVQKKFLKVPQEPPKLFSESERSADQNQLSFQTALFEQHSAKPQTQFTAQIFNDQEPILQLSEQQTPASSSSSKRVIIGSKRTSLGLVRLQGDQQIKYTYLKNLERRAQIKASKEEQQLKECRHTPQLNSISQLIAQGRRQQKPIQQHLALLAAQTEAKKQRVRTKHTQQILEECPFQPHISSTSQLLAAKNSERKSLTDQKPSSKTNQATSRNSEERSYGMKTRTNSVVILKPSNTLGLGNRSSSTKKLHSLVTKGQNIPTTHNYSKPLANANQTQDNNLFRPVINKISNKIVESKGKAFEERQTIYQNQKKHKLIEMYKKHKLWESIDPESGKQLFKPQISSTPNKNSSKTPGANSQQVNVEKLVGKLSEPKRVVNIVTNQKPTITDNSENLVKLKQQRRIAYIFGELDSDQDGVISASKIEISTIDPNLLQIIMPVLFEMEDQDHTLTIREFRQAMYQLHKGLNSQQKAILYGYPGNKLQQ